MSTVLQESPLSSRIYSAHRPIVYRVSNALYTSAKFRYLCKVTIDGTVRAELAVIPNAVNQGIFDIQQIARAYLYPLNRGGGESIHVYRGVSRAPDTDTPIRQVRVDLGWQAAASATASPVKTYDTTRYVMAALFAGDNADTDASNVVTLGGTNITAWTPNTNHQGWNTERVTDATAYLTGPALRFQVTPDDWGVASFYYGDNSGGNRDINSAPTILRTAWRTSSGWTTQDISLTLTAAASITTDFQMVGVVPMAPKNWTLNSASSNLKTALLAGTVLEYELQLRTASTRVSSTLNFTLVSTDCKFGTPVRIGWSNRAGGVDYFNFTKKRVQSTSIETQTYHQDAGTWQANTTFLGWTADQGGETTYSSSSRRSIMAETDWITDADARFLEGLFVAEKVWLIDPNAALEVPSIKLREKEYTKKNYLNDGLVKYAMTFDYTKFRDLR